MGGLCHNPRRGSLRPAVISEVSPVGRPAVSGQLHRRHRAPVGGPWSSLPSPLHACKARRWASNRAVGARGGGVDSGPETINSLFYGEKKRLIARVVGALSCTETSPRCPLAAAERVTRWGGTAALLVCPLYRPFGLFPPVFAKFISLQELKQQYCPLAEKLFAAEKSEVLPVPAMLQEIGTAVYITRQTKTKLLPNLV